MFSNVRVSDEATHEGDAERHWGRGLIGLTFSALVVLGVDSLPIDNPAMEYILNPKLSWPIALICVSILAAIGLLAGILPARKAAQLDPVESLRYE